MAIIKSRQAGDYTVIPNEILRSKLSLEARGLLATLLSNSPDWVIYKTTLHKTFNIGREKLDRMFKELQDSGYIISVKRVNSENGRFEYDHVVYDLPYNGEPLTEIPYTGLPSTVEQPLINNKQTSTNKTSTNKTKEKSIKKETTLFDEVVKDINIPFDAFWDAYKKKVGEKGKLSKKWSKLKDDERVLIMDYVPKYVMATPDKKFRKNPETFLNNKSWLDELPQTDVTSFDKPIEERDAEFKDNLRAFKKDYDSDMLSSFYAHWSERNETGDMMRFELEPTWELEKRLFNWHSRQNSKR